MTTPLASFLSLLVSLNVPGDKVPAVIAAAEEAFGGHTIGSGSTERQRERWRLKQQRKRARRKKVPPGDTGDTSRSAIVEEIPFTDLSLQKKVRKSDSAKVNVPRGDKAKRSVGDKLPDDWTPTEDHYTFGQALGFDRPQVSGFAERMRDWAIANEHRQVARKAGVRGWNAAFRNWLDGAHKRQNGGSNATNRTGAAGRGSGHSLAARLRKSVDDRGGSPRGREPGDGR